MGDQNTKYNRDDSIFKPRSREAARAGKYLKSLNSFQDIHELILDGKNPIDIARYVQNELRDALDVSDRYLSGMIREYRNSIPAAELIRKMIPEAIEKAEEKLEKGMDELVELQRLYYLQMERIKTARDFEKKTKLLDARIVQEIRTAREILASSADLKMDLGLTDRHLGRVEIDGQIKADVMQQYGKESVAKVLSDPESRQRVLGAAKSLLKMAAKEDIVDAVIEPEKK